MSFGDAAPPPDNARTMHVLVESHEGLQLYSDDAGRQGVRVLGHLSVTMHLGPNGEPQTCWRSLGVLGVTAQALADFYINNPGVKEAVDGMFALNVRQRQVRSGGVA